MKQPKKLFIVRKYIMATSAQQAIRKDKTSPVEDCWIDYDYKKQLVGAIGFAHYEEEE